MATQSRDEFLDQVCRLVLDRFPLVKLERDRLRFSLLINGHMAPLENLYRLSAREPGHLPRHVERWVVELLRAAEGSPDQHRPYDAVCGRIMPVVTSERREDLAIATIVSQPLVEGLIVCYALDADRTIAYIPRQHFAQWKIDLEDLHQVAIANLVACSESLNARAAVDDDGRVSLVMFQTLDGYDASRILLPMLHDEMRQYLGSPFLAGIPNRDILLCFRDEEPTRQRVRERIEEDHRTMPHQITDKVFLITPDGIAPCG